MSTSIGTPIDGADGRGRAGGNLTMDIGGGRVEMVLVGPEGVECNID